MNEYVFILKQKQHAMINKKTIEPFYFFQFEPSIRTNKAIHACHIKILLI